jgi:hypothetical protein
MPGALHESLSDSMFLLLLLLLLLQVGTLLHKLEVHLKGHMKQSHAAYDETIGELAAAAEPAAAAIAKGARSHTIALKHQLGHNLQQLQGGAASLPATSSSSSSI